ncbi:unnamed protein product [Effrenium voratum]|uniref:Uncharacterized protein n=1 Tax=Effrenium voratum TaxID=2562239 RepID=A0AA36JA26_9DINO|nr:unnamed protein product [Effrenium voratum]
MGGSELADLSSSGATPSELAAMPGLASRVAERGYQRPTTKIKTFREMVCGDEGDDFVCGYPMYMDRKTEEPFVLELYRAKNQAAKDLITQRLRHNALTIVRHMIREKAKPNKMHYPLPVEAVAPLPMDPIGRHRARRWRWSYFL